MRTKKINFKFWFKSWNLEVAAYFIEDVYTILWKQKINYVCCI